MIARPRSPRSWLCWRSAARRQPISMHDIFRRVPPRIFAPPQSRDHPFLAPCSTGYRICVRTAAPVGRIYVLATRRRRFAEYLASFAGDYLHSRSSVPL